MASVQPVGATTHGFPRFGPRRELKRALEDYWSGSIPADELHQVAAGLRAQALAHYADAGLTEFPVGDQSLYDHVLDVTMMVGAAPAELRDRLGEVDAAFALARGTATTPALEMTKWFDTNYHYLVPVLAPDTAFSLHPERLLSQVREAQGAGLTPRPVVLGPFSYLKLADSTDGGRTLAQLPALIAVYAELLGELQRAGVEWVQLDEPVLVSDLAAEELELVEGALASLTEVTDRPKILIGTYFGDLGPAARILADSAVDGVAVDLVSGSTNQAAITTLPGFSTKRVLAGVVDGRNVWASDLTAALTQLEQLQPHVGQLDVATSCSLLHVPLDLGLESGLPAEVGQWLAFAVQKLDEVAVLARGLRDGRESIADRLRHSEAVARSRRDSTAIINPAARARIAAAPESDSQRPVHYRQRATQQADRLGLPLLPTTTIGSFPQTPEVRAARAGYRSGRLDAEQYQQSMRSEIDAVVGLQDRLGLDVLVHGEPERNDMVQYFAEQLSGFVTTQHGWVQSYGSRLVRPPILFGDVARPAPVTVAWTSYAQSRTTRPVKGMLTGPVTILAWSFVRDDQPLADTASQVAYALRDEVEDLDAAGIAIIQVDEPALRELLPLRAADQPAYLAWATRAFRIATSGVRADTQIHTHMCYADFGDIFEAIEQLDADVISLEAARSGNELAEDLARHGYRKGIGPGVYDIHSPRIPSVEEMAAVILAAREAVPVERLWINPDCGLKTRTTEQVTAALTNLVDAAGRLRRQLAPQQR